MSCQDWPCCGHEDGCCPSFDENGKQLDMVCTCGKRLPVDAPYSICGQCMKMLNDGYDDIDESMDGDHESGLASAGFGTDEDYGAYGEDTPMFDDYYGGE